MTQKKTQKSVIKTLKTLHDYLKAQKNISTRTEFLRFVEKASSENPLVRDFLLRDGRMGVFEPDFTEIFDSGKTPYTKDAGKTKTRADIIHAKTAIDKISIDSKYSNTVGQMKMYITQYFSPGICSDRFHGYVRLSMPIECDGAVEPAPAAILPNPNVKPRPLRSDLDGGAGQPNAGLGKDIDGPEGRWCDPGAPCSRV